LLRHASYRLTTGYNEVIEFLRAVEPINLTFAIGLHMETKDVYEQGKDVLTIPKLTRHLILELRVNGTLTSTSSSSKPGTGFATLQDLDEDNPTPSPEPSQSSYQRKSSAIDLASFAKKITSLLTAPIFVPAKHDTARHPTPTKMADTLNRSERKQ